MSLRKLKFVAGFIMLAALVTAPVALASNQNKVSVLPKTETVNKDYFASGNTVAVDGTVNGDVYAAGGQVTVNGTINGDLLASGGTITVSGKINGNIRAAGGQIIITGTVTKNVTLAGGTVQVSGSGDINGNMVVAAGNLILSSPVDGSLTAAVGSATISDRVGGDINAATGQLTLTSSAKVGGQLSYMSRNTAAIDSGASIGGSVTRKEPPISRSPIPRSVPILLGLLANIIIGGLLLVLLPHYTKRIIAKLGQHTWQSMLWGFLGLVITPIIGAILLVTIIGIPFAILLGVLYGIGVWIAPIWTIIAVGLFVTNRFSPNSPTWVALVFGALLYMLIQLIPIVGGIVATLAVLFGFGAALLASRDLFAQLREDRLI